MIIDGNKYIQFELLEDGEKTQDWIVVSKNNRFNLGLVTWYNGWRQYVFQPSEDSEFNNTCLECITAFLTRLNSVKRIVQAVLAQRDRSYDNAR